MRLDAALVDQPAQVRCIAVRRIGHETRRPDIEPILHPLDQITGAVREERSFGVAAVKRAAGSVGASFFGTTGVAAPNAASSSVSRY